jgi:tripartite-type tricarboxylate transporter receptor subunit TctC
METTMLRFLISVLAAAFAVSCAWSQDFPTRPIRIMVGLAPGGPGDIIERALAQGLTDLWGQPVLVENRPGASGILAAEAVAKAPADGYTLLHAASYVLCVNPLVFDTLPYTEKSFAPVTMLVRFAQALVVSSTVPARNLEQFIELVRSRPGQLNYGSWGPGTPPHLGIELLKGLAGIDLVNVQYKGNAPVVADLIAGRIHATFVSVNAVEKLVQAGRGRALAVSGSQRSSLLPDVPTFFETGYPKMKDAGDWYSILAPAGTPRDILNKLQAGYASVVRDPKSAVFLQQRGYEPVASSAKELATTIHDTLSLWAPILQNTNLKSK